MSLEINYVDAPEGAQEKMTVIGECGNVFSDPSMVATGARDVPWATLEPGIWKLDGTMKIMPDEPNPGWWSKERSSGKTNAETSAVLGRAILGKMVLGNKGTDKANGFENPPKIIITFPEPYGSTGFTFRFSPSTNQWCSKINVTWYLGQSLLISKDYYPTSANWTLQEAVESFDKLEILLLETNRVGEFAKIQRIEIGRTVLLGANEIVAARLVNEVDPSLCELTVDTLSFEMYDPKDRQFMPQENQKVQLIKDGKLRATQYITSSTRKAKSNYEIECQSAIGLLNDEYLGGIYNQIPLEEVVSDILGEWEYEISPYFANEKITGYLPVCSQREALQQVAFSVGAIVSTQDSAKIRLLPIPSVVTSRFTDSEILLGGSVKTAPRYARVEVVSHTYTKTDVQETLMDEEEVIGSDVLVTFSYPHYDYEITGGTITESDVNWVKISADGLVTLTAKTYLHTTRTHTKRNPEATAKERGNYIAIKECTLIHSGNVEQAADRLYAAKQRRQTVNQDVIVSGQKAGSMASSMTPWGTVTKGFISSMESHMTQTGHTATIEIQGIEVELEAVWLYSGEMYSGGQEVVY